MKSSITKFPYEISQDKIAEELDLKDKRYIRCPECKTVYKDIYELIHCGHCGYTRDDYLNINGTVTKKK